MQMIFQDPYASLNPRMRVVDIVGEAPVVHGMIGQHQQVEYVGLQLNRVGLDPTLMRRFPHQFSGGQRARIGIARALAVKPEFLVCDESVAALDVSIQAQVLNLFMDLRAALNLTYLFISHDLGVVRHISDRIVVMYLGRVVESGATAEIFAAPNHPYTQALLAEVGRIDATKRTLRADPGRDSVAARAAGRVSLPSALPACDATLRTRGALARGDRAGTLERVLSKRAGDRVMTVSAPPRSEGRTDPAGVRFAAQRDGLSGRFRPFGAARDGAPSRGHACRRAVRCRAGAGRDAGRSAVPARLHRSEPARGGHRCRAPRRRMAGSGQRVAQDRTRHRPGVATRGGRRADVRAQARGGRSAAEDRRLLRAISGCAYAGSGRAFRCISARSGTSTATRCPRSAA